MSQVLIRKYLAELAKLRPVGGTHRESIAREKDEAAFGRYRSRDLVLAYMDRVAEGDLRTVIDGL
jgi:hypothetical protein